MCYHVMMSAPPFSGLLVLNERVEGEMLACCWGAVGLGHPNQAAVCKVCSLTSFNNVINVCFVI